MITMNNDLISRQAAIDTAISGRVRALPTTEDGEDWIRVNEVRDSLLTLPSAQRTGRWIVVSDGYGNGEATACICECSECKDTIWVYKKSDRKWKYCPNCGARMEGVEDGSD